MVDDKRDLGSLLGQGSAFNGKLTFLGTVRIEGRIEGEIFSDDTLVVSDGGEVRGSVNVGTLVVTGGLVEATIHATQAVEIHPGGTVRGEVVAPEFQIERGAIFQGTSAMPEIVEDEAEADSEE